MEAQITQQWSNFLEQNKRIQRKERITVRERNRRKQEEIKRENSKFIVNQYHHMIDFLLFVQTFSGLAGDSRPLQFMTSLIN